MPRRSSPRHSLATLATLAASTAIAACATGAPAPATPTANAPGTVRFLLVNDVYVSDTLRDGTGGLARLPVLRRQVAGDAPVITVLAGDVLSPSLLSKWYAGRQMVDAFNAVGLDYATFGNHEFELDRDTLIDRVRESRFTWISTNCGLSDGRPFPGVKPWDTTTVNGVRVGFFGLTLPGAYRKYVRCDDPIAAADSVVRTLRDAGAQLIVGITHQNVEVDSALLARDSAVALILGGHEHEWHRVDVGGRLVVKADANARTAQSVVVRRDGGRWAQRAQLDTLDQRLAFDPVAERITSAWRDTLLRRLGPETVVGTAPEPLDARDAVQRHRETILGDLVTDAMRAGTGADLAVMNSGTMRLDDIIAAGPVTSYRLESVFLFPDETRIVVFPITGARLRALLENGVSEQNYGRGGFPQVSGFAFSFDPSRPSGSRVVGDIRLTSGRVLAPGDTVRLAFNAYPACDGGDGYQVPEASAACTHASAGPRAVDLLIGYIRGPLGGRIAERAGENRITQMR